MNSGSLSSLPANPEHLGSVVVPAEDVGVQSLAALSLTGVQVEQVDDNGNPFEDSSFRIGFLVPKAFDENDDRRVVATAVTGIADLIERRNENLERGDGAGRSLASLRARTIINAAIGWREKFFPALYNNSPGEEERARDLLERDYGLRGERILPTFQDGYQDNEPIKSDEERLAEIRLGMSFWDHVEKMYSDLHQPGLSFEDVVKRIRDQDKNRSEDLPDFTESIRELWLDKIVPGRISNTLQHAQKLADVLGEEHQETRLALLRAQLETEAREDYRDRLEKDDLTNEELVFREAMASLFPDKYPFAK